MSSSAVMMYGRAVTALRRFTIDSMDREPQWRRRPDQAAADQPMPGSAKREKRDG